MRTPKFTEEEARQAIAASLCWSDALRRLGLRAAGGNHRTIQRWAAEWGIPTAHFDPDAVRRRTLGRPPTLLEEMLVEHSTFGRQTVKRRLLEAGLKQPVCELCGQGELWRGRRLSLILDHANGVRDDNRLENLRIVCPNCAATLDTHCGRQNRLPEESRACLHCGVSFITDRCEQKYCSRYCGSRYDRHGLVRPGARRVVRPPHAQLLTEVEETSWSAVGRKYGVSDNAVRKWVRAYERERS